MRHLRAIIFDKRMGSKWGDYLPLVQRIMNSSVHRSIGVTPASLLFGNALDLDRRIFIDNVPGACPKTKLSKWTADMLQNQSTLIKVALQHLTYKDEVHMQKLEGIEKTSFPIDSYVLVYDESERDGQQTKLLPTLKGPYRVVNKKQNGNIYTLQNLVTNTLKDYNIHSLRPFTQEENNPKPVLDIAVSDTLDMAIPRRILEHRGNPKKRKSMASKVLWKFRDDDEYTWEPWLNIRFNEVLIDYLRNHQDPAIQRLAPPISEE